MKYGILVGLVVGLLSPLCLAETITVDDDGSADYSSIQDAIDNSNNEDIVEVSPGTYGPISFSGKAITVRGISGPASTTITGVATDIMVSFTNNEGLDSILDGFSITNRERGIVCFTASPTINNCIISGHSNESFGGAVFCTSGSSPSITNSTIIGNAARVGGGIGCRDNSNARISGCDISANQATQEGGGIWCQDSSLLITNNTITGNWSTSEGGGLSFERSSAEIRLNTISNNSASNGGGLHCQNNTTLILDSNTISDNHAVYSWGGAGGGANLRGTVAIRNCVFSDNTAGEMGGGITCAGGTYEITNCLIVGNESQYGAGINTNETNLIVKSCTITANVASVRGGGIHCHFNSDITVSNCVLWDNSSPLGPEIAVFSLSHPSALTVS